MSSIQPDRLLDGIRAGLFTDDLIFHHSFECASLFSVTGPFFGAQKVHTTNAQELD